MKRLSIFFIITFLLGCSFNYGSNRFVVCPKVKKSSGDELYCSIPYVEMQANYHDLDGMKISVGGVLSLMGGEAVLVDPSTKDFEIPQHYNVVALELEKGDYERLKIFHGKYVTVFGRFNARYGGSENGMDMIAHSIESPEVYESAP